MQITKKNIYLTVLVLFLLYVIYFFLTFRPPYIFINQVVDHKHDLSLKMSIKMATKRSGIENAVILLDKLPENETLAMTADRLFKKYRVGSQKKGKGILYLYVADKNLFRIEVSYALEGIFTDATCRHLEDAAKTFMLSDTWQDFLSELLITMNIEGQKNKIELNRSYDAPAWFKDRFLSGGAGAQTKGYEKNVENYLDAIEVLDNNQLLEFTADSSANQVLSKYLLSLEQGIGDPNLPLLTEGSQVFRVVSPRNSAQQQRVRDYYRQAEPHYLFENENSAVAYFKSGVPTLPIFLRRDQKSKLWYVDEPKSWSYYQRYEDGNDFYPKYDDLPFLKELAQINHPSAKNVIFVNRVRTPELLPYPYSLKDLIRESEAKIRLQPKNPIFYQELADIYLFEVSWVTKALEYYEKASELEPENLEYRWRLFDLYMNNSQADKSLEQLSYLAKKLPKDAEVQLWDKYYFMQYFIFPWEFKTS